MIRATIGILAGSAGGFDADAQAFFDRVDTAGGTLSTTEQDAVNTLVVQMKADGIWSKMKAIYPMVGASAAACAQNLKSSSFTGSFSSGWTFASTGVTPNGTSAYMDTGFAPNGNLSQNDAHASLYSRTNNVGTTSVDLGCGYTGSNADFYLSAYYSAAYRAISNINGSGFGQGSSNTTSLGLFLSQRTTSTNTNIYQNNNLIKTHSQTSTTPTSVTVNLGRNTTSEYSDRELSFVSLGDSFTTDERTDLYDAVQAFQTTLSREV